MSYLLDVNALIAFGIIQHQFHQRVVEWIRSQRGSTFLTSSITEIGFVRVVASVAVYGLSVVQARMLLLGMKGNRAQPLTFIADGNDISALPRVGEISSADYGWISAATREGKWGGSG